MTAVYIILGIVIGVGGCTLAYFAVEAIYRVLHSRRPW